jgi:hypothetical protein
VAPTILELNQFEKVSVEHQNLAIEIHFGPGYGILQVYDKVSKKVVLSKLFDQPVSENSKPFKHPFL